MVLYIIVSIFPIISNSIVVEKDSFERQNRTRVLIALIPMFLLIAFRSNLIGADTLTYEKIFLDISKYSWDQVFNPLLRQFSYQHLEIGFVVFCKLIGFITDSAIWFQIIVTIIYFIAYYRFFVGLGEYSVPTIYFFMTLGTYIFLFTGIRQNIAICLCLMAFQCCKERRIIRYILCIAVAFLFHKSAILFLPVYLLYRRKANKLSLFIDIIFGVVLYANFDAFQTWFASSFDYTASIEYTGSSGLFFILFTILTVVSIYSILKYEKVLPEDEGIINLAIVANIFWSLRLLSRTAERPAFYYCIFSYILFSKGLVSAKKNNRNLYIIMIILAIASLVLYIYRFTYNTTLCPYHFFFA